MESKMSKGCSTILLVFLFFVIALVVFGYFFLRNLLAPYKAAIHSTERIEQKFGKIEEFCPKSEVIEPRQIEKFIFVLKNTKPLRENIARTLQNFKLTNFGASTANINWKREVKIATRLGFKFAMFYNQRNRYLTEAGLGLGEYYYLYSAVYYGWMKKNPLDYYSLRLGKLKINSENYIWYQEQFDDESESLLSEQRRAFRIAHIRKILMPILKNQLNYLVSQKSSVNYVECLSKELEKLESDTLRIPFMNGICIKPKYLPKYRSQLDSLFCPQTDFYELFPVHKN